MPNPLEDYQGPMNNEWLLRMEERRGDESREASTRMKGNVIERNPKFWDKMSPAEDTDE